MSLLPRRLGYGEEATLVEHLEELRRRIFVIIGALAIGTIVAFVFHAHVLDWLNRPLPPNRRHPWTFGVAEPFTVSLTVSLYAGFVLSLPVILWQVWMFFMPAVDPAAERRVARLVGFAIALAASGLAFGYWVLLPRAVHWLTNYDSRQFHIVVQAKAYYSFVATVLLGMTVVFELPLAVLGLVYIGVLSSAGLRRNRRIGYFIVAVVALGLPGPDLLTTALELLPMWALFEGSIWLAWFTERRRQAVAPEAVL
ncbi:MAG TPA: twin-arginine translocase subunit TatC [Gaiellaceae bacterium]|jgi:sec-independent protein translocase protein TatC|nr:twin-arginine translocase subunit TatC [Gaiellaceae bacterium]